MRIHRIYCNSVSGQGNVFDLDQPQSTHISKVLRLKLGNEIDVFDGKGSSAICKIIEINRSSIVLERISEVKKLNPTHPKINAILPLIKKDNLHFMLQKLTEVGVYKFIFYKPGLVDQSIAKKDSEKIINEELLFFILTRIKNGVDTIDQKDKEIFCDTIKIKLKVKKLMLNDKTRIYKKYDEIFEIVKNNKS